MLQSQSLLAVIDNSKLKMTRCIRVSQKSSAKTISVGDFFIGSVLNKSLRSVYKSKHMLFLCVGCKKNYRGLNGVYIKFQENKGVMFLNPGKLYSKKILGASLLSAYKGLAAAEFNFKKVNSLVEYLI